MSEQTEVPKNISEVEFKRAEGMLSPEQRVQSKARYEVQKHKSAFLEAGVGEDQFDQASFLASEAALKEYRALVDQNPWDITMKTIKKAVDGFEGHDKLIADNLISLAQSFPVEWRDAIKLQQDLLEKSKPGAKKTIREHVSNMVWFNQTPSGVRVVDDRPYPSFDLLDTKNRHVYDSSLELDDVRRTDLVAPSRESISAIFEAFGAELPTLGKEIDTNKHVETNIPGTFLSVEAGKWARVAVHFDLDTLEKIITLPTDSKNPGESDSI